MAHSPTAIVKAAYRPSSRGIAVTMRNGLRVVVPLDIIGVPGISNATSGELIDIDIEPLCDAIWFPRIDEGFSVTGLLVTLFRQAARQELNRDAAKRTSPKKTAAAQRNGQKGGLRKTP